jgi:hypothetical protein
MFNALSPAAGRSTLLAEWAIDAVCPWAGQRGDAGAVAKSASRLSPAWRDARHALCCLALVVGDDGVVRPRSMAPEKERVNHG